MNQAGRVYLSVKFAEYPDTFDIELLDWHNKPDCKIGHFGYNFYFRTPLGLKYGKYSSIQAMKRAITRTAKAHGLTATNYYYSVNQ